MFIEPSSCLYICFLSKQFKLFTVLIIKYFNIEWRCLPSASINNIGFILKSISNNLIETYIEFIKVPFLFNSPK